MGDPMYTSGQVAGQVQLPRHRLAYLIESGLLPGPSLEVPGRRLFTASDIARIREVLERRPDLRSSRRGASAGKEVQPE